MLAPVPTRPRRLAVLGSPQEAAVALRALDAADFDIVLAISRPDVRRGRGREPSPTPLKAAALELGIPVTHELEAISEVSPDLGVVVAYGRIIPTEILTQVPMVNLHFSLLPRWRGAAPVERAILAGDEVTGVCLMRLEPELDTGPVYDRVEVSIQSGETASQLRSRLSVLGADLLVERVREGFDDPVPQAGETTYAAKVEPSELSVDWSRPSSEVMRLVRIGGAWTTFRSKRLKLIEVSDSTPPRGSDSSDTSPELAPGELSGTWVGAGDRPVMLVRVQPEGKAPMHAEAWSRGARPTSGEALGS